MSLLYPLGPCKTRLFAVHLNKQKEMVEWEVVCISGRSLLNGRKTGREHQEPLYRHYKDESVSGRILINTTAKVKRKEKKTWWASMFNCEVVSGQFHDKCVSLTQETRLRCLTWEPCFNQGCYSVRVCNYMTWILMICLIFSAVRPVGAGCGALAQVWPRNSGAPDRWWRPWHFLHRYVPPPRSPDHRIMLWDPKTKMLLNINVCCSDVLLDYFN